MTDETVAYMGWGISAQEQIDGFRREVRELKTENAKLRELLADAWGYINHPANAMWTHKKRKEVRDSLSDRMRELGIDADGGTMARLRSDRTAPRVIVADGDTDCATGHCECGGCGGAIDCWDRFCRHCGRELEDA